MSANPLAFVIMPFSSTVTCSEEQWTEVFEDVFRPALEGCGYTCERAKPATGNMIVSIVERLRAAPLVLADLTDRNANVFYELGVRHSLKNGTVIVSQRAEDVPSDLRGYWHLPYGLRPAQVRKFKTQLSELVRNLTATPMKPDNPTGVPFPAQTDADVF